MGHMTTNDKLTYFQMAEEAIRAGGNRNGTSKQAILKFICEKYPVDQDKAKSYLTAALKKAVENGTLKMAKETGKGSNSYKLDVSKREKSAKKPKVKAAADREPVSKPNTATAKTKAEK